MTPRYPLVRGGPKRQFPATRAGGLTFLTTRRNSVTYGTDGGRQVARLLGGDCRRSEIAHLGAREAPPGCGRGSKRIAAHKFTDED
jgi:hypothetical protein